jgi:hypothetical protein
MTNIENEVALLKRRVRDLEQEVTKVRRIAEEALDADRIAKRLSEAVTRGEARLVASEVKK